MDLNSLLNLSRLQPELAVAEAAFEHKEELLKLNDAQLDRGVGSDNHDLGEYRNFKYKNRFRPIDLLKTGEFRAREDIIFDNDEMVFIDLDEKTPGLETKYGEVLGLTDESQSVAGQLLLPSVIEKLNEQLV